MMVTPGPLVGFPVRVGKPTVEIPDEVERRMTPQEVADLMQVSIRTVWRHCRDGILPHERVGRVIRITPADLKVYRTRLGNIADNAASQAATRGNGKPGRKRGRFAQIAQGIDDGGSSD